MNAGDRIRLLCDLQRNLGIIPKGSEGDCIGSADFTGSATVRFDCYPLSTGVRPDQVAVIQREGTEEDE